MSEIGQMGPNTVDWLLPKKSTLFVTFVYILCSDSFQSICYSLASLPLLMIEWTLSTIVLLLSNFLSGSSKSSNIYFQWRNVEMSPKSYFWLLFYCVWPSKVFNWVVLHVFYPWRPAHVLRPFSQRRYLQVPPYCISSARWCK